MWDTDTHSGGAVNDHSTEQEIQQQAIPKASISEEINEK